VRDLPTFRDAYRKRRCIVPVDGFFEWKAIKGQKAKQPYAIAMRDGAPLGVASAGPFPCRWPVLIFVVAETELPDLLSAWM
jgi:hypothetical protein